MSTGTMKSFKVVLPYFTVFGGVLILGFSALSIISPNTNIQGNKEYITGLKNELFSIFTDSETVEITESETTQSIDFITEYIITYGHDLVEAINTGDFSIVDNALYPDSPLYKSQKKLVDRLYRGGISEEIVRYEVDAIRIVSDEWVEVDTYEAIDVYHPGELKETKYNWQYRLKWSEQAKQYLLYSIE